MTPLALAVLAFLDGTLCGFRAAAGRNPRIFTGPYYLAAMRRGAALSLVVLLAFVALTSALRLLGGEALWSELLLAGDRLVLAYGCFATLVLAALGLYLVGSFDFAVLASVLVLGPFTLLRPWVIAAGAGWAALASSSPLVAAVALLAGAVMVGFERLLDLGTPPWRGLEGDRPR